MSRTLLITTLGVLVVASQTVTFSQSKPSAATYITDEEVKAVNATPGVDRTIRVVDIGNEHFAVGIIHRVASGAAARGTGAGAGAAAGPGRGTAGGGGRANAAPTPCGEQASTPPEGSTPGGITHDSQTEGYVIVSGSGTLITGGHIVNGSRSAPDGAVTRELNGPSCSGLIVGSDVVKRVVKTGDIIIIPAGVPHGWTDISDHVDYLSLRPSDHVLEAGYVHPAIKK
jgi:mannose-6-phosphate isomerase-like protein (cupin superfamily)